jgi:hypothetical protein
VKKTPVRNHKYIHLIFHLSGCDFCNYHATLISTSPINPCSSHAPHPLTTPPILSPLTHRHLTHTHLSSLPFNLFLLPFHQPHTLCLLIHHTPSSLPPTPPVPHHPHSQPLHPPSSLSSSPPRNYPPFVRISSVFGRLYEPHHKAVLKHIHDYN